MSNFSILNESSLHKSLKKIYECKTNGSCEVEKNGHIYDIIAEDGEIIEIQNLNLKALLPKIKDSLEKGEKVRIVHPLIISKIIELKKKDGDLIKTTKSPKKGCIYDIFNEIKGIYSILLNKNFCLEIPEITVTEIRTKEDDCVQSKNKKRRFKKDWNKSDKKLKEIGKSHIFSSPEHYLSLLPESLKEEFTSKDLSLSLKEESCPSRIYKNSSLILWVLRQMQLIKLTKTEKRSNFYKINKEFQGI